MPQDDDGINIKVDDKELVVEYLEIKDDKELVVDHLDTKDDKELVAEHLDTKDDQELVAEDHGFTCKSTTDNRWENPVIILDELVKYDETKKQLIPYYNYNYYNYGKANNRTVSLNHKSFKQSNTSVHIGFLKSHFLLRITMKFQDIFSDKTKIR